MAMGSGISVMGKNTDLDANQVGSQQALIDKLLMQSLQAPKTPELSWTQGAARMAEMLVSAYKQKQLQKKQDLYNQNRQNSMGALASALGSGDQKQIAAAVGKMNDPQSQMMALNFLSQTTGRQNERENEVFKNNLGMQRDAAKEKGKGQHDPVKNVQSQLNDVAEKNNQINRLIATTQDPQQKAKLQELSTNLQATQASLLSQIKGVKGVEPDLRKEYSNQGFAALAAGAPPNSLPPAQAEAMRSISLTPKLEPAMNAEIGKGIGQSVNDDFNQFKEGASASRDIASKGSQILQMLASNPDVNGGWGKENVTKFQTLMNRMFPGIAPNVGDQQGLQKLIGQLTPQAVGNLRQEGVQRITQGEIMNLIPKITATMENDREGMKQILELHSALDVPIQQANDAMLKLRNQYAKNPGSFDIGSAMNDLQLAMRKEVQASSLNYMNNKLANKGEKLTINPNWDEKTNTLDKYVRVPSSQKDDQPLQVIPDTPNPSPNQLPSTDTAPSPTLPPADKNPSIDAQIQKPSITPVSYEQPDNVMKDQIAAPPVQNENIPNQPNYGGIEANPTQSFTPQSLPQLPPQQSFDPNSPAMLASLLAKKDQQQQMTPPDFNSMNFNPYQNYSF